MTLSTNVPQGQRRLRALAGLFNLQGKPEPENEPDQFAFKSYGGYWIARWTNNFQDRQQETFSEKALDDYIQRVDVGIIPKPELWLYHAKGSRIGEADMIARVGHFVLAVGRFDETSAGQAAQKSLTGWREALGVSHGFTYLADDLRDGVYHAFNTFEISVLPSVDAAANPFTSFEDIKNMSISEQKAAFLQRVLGDAEAARVVKETEAAGKALEEAGVAFKQYASAEDPQVGEKDNEAHKALEALVADLISDQSEVMQATVGASKALTAYKAELDALRAEVDTFKSDLAKSVASAVKAAVRDALTPASAQAASAQHLASLAAAVVEDAKLKENLDAKDTDAERDGAFRPFGKAGGSK